MKHYRKIGFIGAGNMAEAMIGAMLQAGLRKPEEIVISDADSGRINTVSGAYGVAAAAANVEVANTCEIVILAVKPQIMDSVLAELSEAGCFTEISRKRLFISIAAGILLSSVERFIYPGRTEEEKAAMPIIRVMPNTPALVGAGMSGMCVNAQAGQDDIEAAKSLLSSMGEVLVFDEEQMDAVTAVSGSGPAYGFYLLEAMVEAAQKLGLERADALKLATGAVSGALQLIKHRDQAPETLRSGVMSPGGTTEAAINLLESHHVKDRIIEAVLTAAQRSRQLSSHQDA